MLKNENKQNRMGFVLGIGITLIIAIIASFLAGFPVLSIMGQLVIAILLGMLWRSTIGLPTNLHTGVAFSSKKLLRLGVILLGMRLNLADIYHAGFSVLLIASINLLFALLVVYGLSQLLKVDKKIGILAACGTAICGAAAIVAIAPQVKAKASDTAIAAAIIALLGTLFTFIYTFLYPLLGLSPIEYGAFTGGTLHEVAHVVAASDVGGSDAVDMAIIVKLTRVALLVPVALIIGILFQRKEQAGTERKFTFTSIPWFVLGFIAMSGLNTLNIIPMNIVDIIVDLAYILIAMAMAGLGLNVQFKAFKKDGLRAFTAGLIGSVLLAVLGFLLVIIFL